jgi:hypothetical protein
MAHKGVPHVKQVRNLEGVGRELAKLAQTFPEQFPPEGRRLVAKEKGKVTQEIRVTKRGALGPHGTTITKKKKKKKGN